MATIQAARMLCLNRGEGEIKENGVADLLVVADSGQNPAEALQDLCPSMVILGGKIQLVSENLAARIDPRLTRGFQKVTLEGCGTWLMNVNISRLRAATEAVLGPDFQLAGRPVR
jgi:hypothetical protein